MKKLELSNILLTIISASLIISLAILETSGPNLSQRLDNIGKLFGIFGSFSLVIALFTYFYKRSQDNLLATVDQITFFREKVISEWDSTQKHIREKNSDFVFSRIELVEPDISIIKNKFSVNFNRQFSIFFNSEKIIEDSLILDKHIILLNLLEEFSLRVIHSKTIENPAFKSLHNAFVEIVEGNAVALLYMRDVKVGNSIYSTTLNLYNVWKKRSIKTNYVKNLEKYGLITKKQKEEIYKERQEKFNLKNKGAKL